jgi:hypothetical protein
MNKLSMLMIFSAGSLAGAIGGTAIGVPLAVRALQADEVKAKKFTLVNSDDEQIGYIDQSGFSFDGPEGKEAFFFRNADRPYISFRRAEKTAVTLGCIGENDGLVTYKEDSPRILLLSAKNYANGLFTMHNKPLDLNELEFPDFVKNPFAFIHADEDVSDITVASSAGKTATLEPPSLESKK